MRCCCCCNLRTRSLISYSTFDFVNESPIYALYFTHSVWWIPFKRDTLSQPRIWLRRQRRPTDVGLSQKTKKNIFRIFCNRWWPENIKCWALIYTHHVHTRSDQIEIAHAQINSTAFHIQRRFTTNATRKKKIATNFWLISVANVEIRRGKKQIVFTRRLLLCINCNNEWP